MGCNKQHTKVRGSDHRGELRIGHGGRDIFCDTLSGAVGASARIQKLLKESTNQRRQEIGMASV